MSINAKYPVYSSLIFHLYFMINIANHIRMFRDNVKITICSKDTAFKKTLGKNFSPNNVILKKAILTDKGRAYAGQVSELIRQAVDAGRNGLTMEETKTFYRVLYHISDNLEQLISVLEEKGQENS